MAVMDQNPPRVRLPGREKLLIAGLLCLQVPTTVLFFPLAAVLVLTGILAPLGMMSFAIGAMPLSMAMKRKAAWRVGEKNGIFVDQRATTDSDD
jgi:hypothetical protein